MNSIRQIRELNKRELENNVSPEASWHADYRDTAYIYIGGLPFELTEGDVITIFSQFGEPTYINLVRDKETGKSKGFAFLKYEDQRSTDLAVDNLGGAVIMNRTLKVDHTRYKKKDDEAEEGQHLDEPAEIEAGDESRRKRRRTSESESEEERPILKEERELAKLIQEHDEDDPMNAFLIQEKKEEVALVLARVKDGKGEKSHKHRHHHRKSRRPKEEDGHRSSHRKEDHDRKRSRSRDRAGKERESRRTRPSEPEKSREYSDRTRSPRRVSRERYRDDGDRERLRKGDYEGDDWRRRSRRDS